jgi:uracil-DNA glycosylase family protein
MRVARVTDHPTLESLREEAADCRACELWQRGTQTVFGEGGARSRIVLVGEQPGDEEDRTGRPFVGPAGRLLDEALAAAGIDRRACYVTNAVKHFKWEPRGSRRIHQKPNAREVAACRHWLDAELMVLHPRALVCLGATAAKALLGPKFKVTEQHGRPVESSLAPIVVATTHPSAVLRMPDADARRHALQALVDDLRVVARLVECA